MDFKQTIRRLKNMSRIVDSEAEAALRRAQKDQSTEVLEAMKSIKITVGVHAHLPCHVLPPRNHEQTYGREDILNSLGQILDPNESRYMQKSLVLHGMGGVGKSKVALEYAYRSREKFDIIFWVAADNKVKLLQGFVEGSRQLQPSSTSGSEDAALILSAMKKWLEETKSQWMLIFDNVEDSEILADAWPRSQHGAVLITSRDLTTGFGSDAEDLQLHPFKEDDGTATLLRLLGRQPSATDQDHAREIVKTLGGLPLAINQMARFMMQHRLGLKDFLPLYLRNSAKIDSRGTKSGGYEHTLSTVWEVSLAELSEPSSSLLRLLAFCDPDSIHESVLREGGRMLVDDEYSFLWDDMDFLDAQELPLRSALIERSGEDSCLKLHRLIQTAIRRKLSDQEKVKCFDSVILLISKAFPNTWNIVTSHQFSAWSQYERCLSHTVFLIGLSQSGYVQTGDPRAFSELIFRICWHLYEREQYEEARKYTQYGFELLNETNTLLCASAQTLQGLIELDMLNVDSALKLFLVGLRIREEHLEPDHELIASSLNAISVAYTELGDIKNAFETGNRAIGIRERTTSDRVGNSYSNMASTLLKMGKADEAEEMLKRCPSLKDFVDETFLKTGNPRFSGDMVLLGRIRTAQRRLEDALRLLSKAVTFRRQVLGNGLKTCDALFHAATVARLQGSLPLAASFFEDSVAIAEDLSGSMSSGYLARSTFHLAQVLATMEEKSRAARYQAQAEAALAKAGPKLKADLGEAAAYEAAVHWMLW